MGHFRSDKEAEWRENEGPAKSSSKPQDEAAEI